MITLVPLSTLCCDVYCTPVKGMALQYSTKPGRRFGGGRGKGGACQIMRDIMCCDVVANSKVLCDVL